MRSWAALDPLAQIEHIHLAVADEIGPIYNASGKRGFALGPCEAANGRNHINAVRREGHKTRALPFH